MQDNDDTLSDGETLMGGNIDFDKLTNKKKQYLIDTINDKNG